MFKFFKLTITALLLVTLTLLTACSTLHTSHPKKASAQNATRNPNRVVLPAKYPVYTAGTTATKYAAKGFSKRMLPVSNFYLGHPGCYIACYSHDKKNSVYPVSRSIYVNGLVRVPGYYNQQMICQPVGYKNKNISSKKYFKHLCGEQIMSCHKNRCWAGGDTGGFVN